MLLPPDDDLAWLIILRKNAVNRTFFHRSRANLKYSKKIKVCFDIKKNVFLPHQNPPSLSTMLKCAGRFFYLKTNLFFMETKIPYEKTFRMSYELVNLLKSRGLFIPDFKTAVRYVENIGYYRLSAYMYPLLEIPKTMHHYKKGASFNQVMMLYRFDKKLRVFIFNEIEKIEIAVRSAIVDRGCDFFGNPFWITDPESFKDVARFHHTLELVESEIKHSREDFIVHFKQKYSEKYPPAWILSEILPFGVMTSVYDNIKDMRLKKNIAQRFGLQVSPFESWLTIVTLTRNACCHHARVWNKQNTILPMSPNRIAYPWISLQTNPLRIYFDLCIVKYFINIISPCNDMTEKLKSLLSDYPDVDPSAMGFPCGWEEEPVWCNTLFSAKMR